MDGDTPPNTPTTTVARSLRLRCSFGSNHPLPTQTPQLTHFPPKTEGTRINTGPKYDDGSENSTREDEIKYNTTGPTVWNSLPESVTSAVTLASFKCKFKISF